MSKRVLIVQSQMKQYRLPLFIKLHAALLRDGVELRVAYSDPHRLEAIKKDNVDLPLEFGLKTRGYWFFGNRVLYQSVWAEICAADLVILEQANKHLINHVLLLSSAVGSKKVAFWGHGRNRGPRRRRISGWVKKWTLKRADWWFAYTAGTVDYLIECGVRPERVTNVQNAIDTAGFRKLFDHITDSELDGVRKKVGISGDSKVAVFCGGVSREKMPEFLVESATRIKRFLPEFELLAIGSGPEQAHFERAAARHSWFHYLGPRFEGEKGLYFSLAEVFLMPGGMGLAILDAFAAGLPPVTTRIPNHGPEIEYLQEGQNGLMTSCDVQEYASATVRLLKDPAALRKLQAGALSSGKEYSIEAMVDRFRLGILQCFGIGPSALSMQNLTAGQDLNSSRSASEPGSQASEVRSPLRTPWGHQE